METMVTVMIPIFMIMVGAVAAASVQRSKEEEEERLIRYSDADLDDGWEFKILRGRFNDPTRLSQALAEEQKAGWILVEKFDEYRVRLKRPTSAKSMDAFTEFDPYRTYIGMSQVKVVALIVGSALLFGAITFAVLFLVLL